MYLVIINEKENTTHTLEFDDDEMKVLIDNIYWLEEIKGEVNINLQNIKTKLEKVIYDNS